MLPESRVETFRKAAQSGSAKHGYKGLPVHALPGLHEFVAQILSNALQPGATVLELAAGTGALSLRLTDSGFKVVACDYVRENYRLHGKVPFVEVDLNQRFAGLVPLADAVVAVEIIEHLENTRHFFREGASALRDNGILVVTTPNLDNPVSLAYLIRGGRPLWFSHDDYRAFGHITPVPLWVMQEAAQEAGLRCTRMDSFGDSGRWVAGWPRMKWFARLIDRVMAGPRHKSEILVAVFQKGPQ